MLSESETKYLLTLRKQKHEIAKKIYELEKKINYIEQGNVAFTGFGIIVKSEISGCGAITVSHKETEEKALKALKQLVFDATCVYEQAKMKLEEQQNDEKSE